VLHHAFGDAFGREGGGVEVTTEGGLELGVFQGAFDEGGGNGIAVIHLKAGVKLAAVGGALDEVAGGVFDAVAEGGWIVDFHGVWRGEGLVEGVDPFPNPLGAFGGVGVDVAESGEELLTRRQEASVVVELDPISAEGVDGITDEVTGFLGVSVFKGVGHHLEHVHEACFVGLGRVFVVVSHGTSSMP
jgi:hypothetical protein